VILIFGHKNILKYCPNRKFNSIEEHDNHIIKQWKLKVKETDVVFHLGDFSFGSVDFAVNILNSLPGKKVLITGNHDKRNLSHNLFRNCFETIRYSYHEVDVTYNGKNVSLVLSHYPIESFNKMHHGAFHLHGHCHSPVGFRKIRYIKNRKDIGVDSREDNGVWEKDELLNAISQENKNTLESLVDHHNLDL
jgi:calcineurin-like phosphoesterase family protein